MGAQTLEEAKPLTENQILAQAMCKLGAAIEMSKAVSSERSVLVAEAVDLAKSVLPAEKE